MDAPTIPPAAAQVSSTTASTTTASSAPLKRCTCCGAQKPLCEFHRRAHYVRAGVRSACRTCTQQASRVARQRRKERGEPRFDDESRQKHRVRTRTKRAVAAGVLQKKPCKVCGAVDVEAHHLHYDKSISHLVVEWLCHEHHALAHGKREWTKQLTLPLARSALRSTLT